MGLFSFIKKALSKSPTQEQEGTVNGGQQDDTTMEEQQDSGTMEEQQDESTMTEEQLPQVEEQSEQVQEQVLDEPVQTTGNELSTLGQRLGTLKKGRFRSTNSAKYEGVRSAVSDVTSATSKSFTGDKATDQRMAMDVLMQYGKLQSACEIYLAKASDRFASGRARKETVEAILALALKDIVGVRSAIDRIPSVKPEVLSSYTWSQVIADSRTLKIELNKGVGQVKTLGGAASTVRRIQEQDLIDSTTGGTGFFKAEEGVLATGETDSGDERYSRTKNSALQAVNLSQSELARIAPINDPYTITNDSKFFDSKAILDFAEIWAKMSSSYAESFRQLFLEGLTEVNAQRGDVVSLTKRNVASSRVAEFLGAGDVIAHSELAEVTDSNGKCIPGMLMQQAHGREGMAIKEDLIRERQTQGFAIGEPGNKREYGEMPVERSTGSLQKSFSTLQVMDYITGQEDRHVGNYMVQQDENGRFTGVTGIDNDFAFGAWTESVNHARHVVKDGRLYIPHMDKSLAERILQLSHDQLVLLLGDLLTPNDIEPCWQRVQLLQEAIKTETSDPNSKVLVANDEDWGEQTHSDFMEKDMNTRRDRGERSVTPQDSSYYSDFMSEKLLGGMGGPFGSMFQEDWIMDDAAKDFDEYMRLRDITTPHLFRHYLINEVHMMDLEVDRLMAQGKLDPLLYTFDEMPSEVQGAFRNFFGTNMKYKQQLRTNKEQHQGGGGDQ